MKAAALSVRALPRLALRLPRRLRPALGVALAAAVALAGLYYGWLRDSSLVQVRDVSVTGLTGPDAERARTRLAETARGMTTLHVREDELARAVESEPSIRAVRATPDFPHGLHIDVLSNHPVAAVVVSGSGRVPIAGNGTLMPGHQTKAPVPDVKIQRSARVGRNGPAAVRLADDRAAALVRVAAAAPPALRHRASAVERRKGEGIVVTMRDGPRVMFGDDSRAADKWRAAAGVLASPNAQGAAYVDVRLPDRPVAGGLKPQASASGPPGAASVAAPGTAAPAPSTPTGGSPPPAAATDSATPVPAPPQPAPQAAPAAGVDPQP